ncbi:hypothetical protein MNBD_GAMMA02-1236 [hydrothermal vent metagenome]|uniref:GGDEF domain-containing protein n=1 Tax=hydrothermal vent metagenome TaxID=652676 RepID=A0A3B0W3U4_9ZZZZ
MWVCCLLCLNQNTHASVVGTPPIAEIDIPSEPYITFFDMTQDHNNVIYVSYEKGIKIYDGSRWHTLLIPNTYLTRVLYFDQQDRVVYVGGFDFFGYIKRNSYGQYEFIDLTPKENPVQFASIWGIVSCEDRIFFRALNHVYAFEPISGDLHSWSFVGRLGDIACFNNRTLLQDRSAGMKELSVNQWLDSPIKLEDNSLIYELEILQNKQIFIRSLTNNWRIIKNNQIKPIRFAGQLPELGTFASSMALGGNKVVLGGKSGSLTFLDFNTYTAESFKLSSGRISAITQANDGGLLILSSLKIYHLSWPSPWRIQDSATGLSSNIYDITTWNDQLYATSSGGVFVEDSDQSTQQHFKQLDWTNQEAWNLLPLNADEILLADSHYAYLISNQEKQVLTGVIYPRIFQVSRHNTDHIFMHTELDTRLLVRNNDSWSNWVVAEGKPSSVIELAADTLLITTVDGRFYKVIINQHFDAVEATIDMSNQANISPKAMTELKLFQGPGEKLFAATSEHYYQYRDDQFIETDLMGLSNVLPPAELSSMRLENGDDFWALSATKIFNLNAENIWQTIDATPYIKGGINDIEFLPEQIKLPANSMILSYLVNQTNNPTKPTGKMLITSAQLNPKDDSMPINLPVDSNKAYVFGSTDGNLTIQFSYTDIKNAASTNYQYRLKGLNEQWSPYSKNDQVSFLELSAGDYEFEVRALDVDGQTHTSQILPFVVEPVWYLTNWAKLLWLLLSMGLLFIVMKLFMKWREKIHEEQKRALKATINERTQELKLANLALQDLAHKDSLTGLSNRLYLDKYINELIDNRISKVAVIMMDMDHFKNYNDTFGHLAGDHLLAKFAKSLLTRIKRKQDLVARYGGEEFLIILPESTEEYTQEAAENIRLHTEEQQEKTTISIGVTFSDTNQTIKSTKDIFELIDQADKALYEAKTTGRNQVAVFNKETTQSD